MKFNIILLILFCFVSNLVGAQISNLKFENFDTFNGLSSSTCKEIFQDKEGFLWFGTIDGLNKYNGYEFEIFRSILNDSKSLSNNRVNTIEEDNEGNLWIGTNNGLNLFNKQTNNFTRINLYRQLSLANSSKKVINDLLYDNINNILWVATNNGVIKINLSDYISNTANYEFSYYINDQSNINSIDNNRVNVILQDENDIVWVGTDGENLNRYNKNKDNFDRVYIDAEKLYELDHITKKVFIDTDGNFWIGNDLSNLILWNRQKNQFSHVSLTDKSIAIFDIYQDCQGLIWVSTDEYGLYLFKKDKGEVKLLQHIVNNFSDPFSLPNNKPSKIFEDRKGIFWIGSYDKGVSKFDPSNYSFKHYYYHPNNTNGLSQKIAQSVLQDSKGRIWISAYNGGLNLFDEEANSFKHFSSNPNNPRGLSSNKILYTFESHDGNIWVCTLDGGVNKFNSKTNKFEVFLHNTKDPNSIGQSSVWAGVEDSKNRIWFALRTEGISLYNPESKQFTNYKSVYGKENSLVSNVVLYTFIDSKNRLHIGTSLGLDVVDLNKLTENTPKDLEFIHVGEKEIEASGINHITEDHDGNIWLGSDSGVFKLDHNLKLIKSYSSQNGLPNNQVVGIIEDNNFNIWITTKGGLSLLNPLTDQFRNFNAHDGLQGSEFQSKSIYKTKNGRIIIGGINGFNIFQPNDIKPSSTVSVKPLITKFKVNNKTVVSSDSINGRVFTNKGVNQMNDVKLSFDENYVSIEFVALYFDNPEQVQYTYRMNGLDNEFIGLGSNRIVTLSNLEPGNYTFEVKASTNSQFDEAQSTFVNIKIEPPLWKTWWAYLIYFIIGGLITWAVLHYYTLKVKEKQQYELDQMKLRFIVNVSHEFRTPLTLILNPVDKILSSFNTDETIQNSAKSIQRSARRLLHLVNQLLDYRKMDVGMSPLQLEKRDIVEFGRDVFSLFKDLALKKEIDYTFNSSSESIKCLFDIDKVEKIITNLISNAIKFTNNGGEIMVSINKIIDSKNKSNIPIFTNNKLTDYIEIIVEDTGVGLDKEQQKQIFSRFFNADVSKVGTGIGLNFTKGLVDLHGGEINVESNFKKGSKFIVKLPLDLKSKPEIVENVKNEFLINSMKAVEYDMFISNDRLPESDNEVIPKNVNKKLPLILIVEDNKELRVHLKNDLKGLYNIKEAVNGEEGLKMVRKHHPDVVISDVMMPKMDGFEMCKLIKTDIETSHIPVMLLTARTLEEDRIEGYKNGANGYLAKPFRIDVLRARVNNLLEAKIRIRKRFSEIGGILPTEDLVTNNLDKVFLDKVTRIIMENVSDIDFKQENLLKEMNIGRSQLYRKINSLTGSNPSNFIRTLRLRYASELIMKNSHSIKEITFMAGFNSTAYFSKTFKDLFKVTPSQYLEQQNKLNKENLNSN